MKNFNINYDDITIDFVLPEDPSEKEASFIKISSTVSVTNLHRDIIGYRKIDEMERRTNFFVSMNEAATEIIISGDLFNALYMMQVRGLLIRKEDLDRLMQSGDYPTFDKCIAFTKTLSEQTTTKINVSPLSMTKVCG